MVGFAKLDMLSYMVPLVEENEKVLKNLEPVKELIAEEENLTKTTNFESISKDTSLNSFQSDVTTVTVSQSSMTNTSLSDKSKPKLAINGGRHQTLKRVSFGSSKGSMVETLIFESPLPEETESVQINQDTSVLTEESDISETEREKVRVSFFQQSRPQEVDLPNEPEIFEDTAYMMAATVAVTETNNHYQRTESVESGWENPFRPGGDLSREADEIVELIKGGKPITPTGGTPDGLPNSHDLTDNYVNSNNVSPSEQKKAATQVESTPKSANGNVKNENGHEAKPGALDVKRETLKPDGDASQVEHITIKKKSKCGCCVIQ